MTKQTEERRPKESLTPFRIDLLFSPRSIVALTVLAFFVILICDAWLHEDAFITLRTVDNFVNGYGLRYNISQRVQTFTHPLWLFLLTVPYAVTREPLFTTLFVSIAVSLTTFFLLLRYLAPSVTAKIVAAVILLSSRAFIDYSTSGLENPLSHLLLVLFLIVYLRGEETRSSLFWMSLLAALAALNRLDSLLFFLPALFVYFLSIRSIAAVLLGFLPLAGWVVFSLFYYGFPIPNSAYAKLNIHIPAGELFHQGLYYFQDVAWRDPLTALTIAAGLLTAVLERRRKQLLFAAGVALYLLYILRIGGDYMSGRFFTTPLTAAVVLLAQSRWLNSLTRARATLVVGGALLLGLLSAHPVLLPIDTDRRWRDDHGITDERQYYDAYTGLIENLSADPPLTKHWLAESGIRAREVGQRLLIKGGIGLTGYFAGPEVHIVDNYALADSLLSHLPVGNPDFWRIGHFNRKRPAGLEASLISGTNEIEDAQIAEYYDKLSTVISGPLFDLERLKSIWRLNTGQYDDLIDPDQYIAQQMVPVAVAQIDEMLPEDTTLDSEDVVYIPYEGVKIAYPVLQQGSLIQLGIDSNYTYRLIFLREGEVVDSLLSQPGSPAGDILELRTLTLPEAVAIAGFDEVRIRPYVHGMDAKNSRGLGFLIIRDEGSQAGPI